VCFGGIEPRVTIVSINLKKKERNKEIKVIKLKNITRLKT
jgi:hypothetical protein